MPSTRALCWYILDLVERPVQGGRHQLVHAGGIVSFDEIGRMAAAAQVLRQLLPVDAGENGGIGDLVAVEMEDGEHGPIGGRIQELVRLPGGGQRAGLGLAVADDAAGDQIRVVEDGSVGVGKRVAQLPAFVDRTRCLRGHMTGDASREGELLEEPLDPVFVLGNVGVVLAVRALQDRRSRP